MTQIPSKSFLDKDLKKNSFLFKNQLLSAGKQSRENIINPIIKHSWSKLSLRFKTTLIAIALGVVPVAGVGSAVYVLASYSIKEKIVSEQEARTVDLAHEVGLFTRGILEEVGIIANSSLLVDPQLRQMTSTEQKIALLDSMVQLSSTQFERLAVLDLEGNLLYQSRTTTRNPPLNSFIDYGKEEYFQRAIATKAAAIKEPDSDPSSGEVSLEIAVPMIAGKTGQLFGLLYVRMPFTHLNSLFENITAQRWEYRLLDTGKRIFATDKQQHLGNYIENAFQTWAQIEEKVWKNGSEPESENNFIDRSLTEILDDKDNGKKVLASVAPIPDRSGVLEPGWTLVISRPEAEAFAPVRELGLILLTGSLAAATLVGALGTILANRATRPILAAAMAVKKIGQGQLDTRVTISGKDEMAMLGVNINQMVGQLEALVNARTLSLRESRLLATIGGIPTLSEAQLETGFASALGEARELLQLERIVIYRIQDDDNAVFACAATSANLELPSASKTPASPIPKALVSSYLVPTAIDDLRQSHPEHLQYWESHGVKALLVVPIHTQGKPHALLIAQNCQGIRVWQEREAQFLTQLASQLGVIFDRFALLDRKAKEAERSRALKDITLKIGNLLSPQKICDSATGAIREILKADRAIVYRFDSDWGGEIISESVVPPWPISLGAVIIDPCFLEGFVEKYQQGRVRAIDDIYQAGLAKCHLEQLESSSVRASLVAPILVKGKLFGLSIAHQCSSPRHWTQPEIDLFTQVATQIGLAIDKAQLLEEQRSAKELLQQRALKLLEEIDPVSKGDLRVRARVTSDEIGTVADFYNATIESLRQIVIRVQEASEQVTTTATSKQAAVEELSAKAIHQSDEIGRAKQRIRAMAESISAVANHASLAEVAVRRANQTVTDGEMAMNRTVSSIAEIRETVAETAKKMKQLGEASQKISKVVSLINKFAEQTSLLALNASIEAARAGEQGRGFAVVAEEVRSLARQSARATAEIEEIVLNIQTQTKEVVSTMEAGTERVLSGTASVEETRRSLNQIATASATIGELVTQIALVAAKQSEEERLVSTAMTEVAAISQHTSYEASVVSASFSELLAVAQKLRQGVGQFKVN